MSKTTSVNNNVLLKTNVALFSAIGMLVGLLISRSLLSFFMTVFGVIALYDIHPRRWLKHKYWLLGLCWVGIYIISWFWSDDTAAWYERCTVKLPVLLFPLAFHFLPAFTARQLRLFTVAVGIMLLYCAGYSVSFFIKDPAYYMEQYRISQVLPTPAGGDYVRFSLTVALFFVWCAYIWPVLHTRSLKWFTGIVMVVIALYLHVLAVRTGLIALYMFVAGWGIFLGLRKSKLLGVAIIVFLIGAAYLGVNYVPTLKTRFGYLSYTYIMYMQGERTGNYSDMGRLISYSIAGKIIKQHPVAGVGAGDMLPAMRQGYKQWYPDVVPEKQLLPHNQFMVVWLGCGIVAFVMFALWCFYPLKAMKKGRERFYLFIVWAILLPPLLVEPMLEVQFGVFVYLFFLLWQKHAMVHKAASANLLIEQHD